MRRAPSGGGAGQALRLIKRLTAQQQVTQIIIYVSVFSYIINLLVFVKRSLNRYF